MKESSLSSGDEPHGYIAGPNGEADWITMDPEIDFGALFAQFDTFLHRTTDV